MGPHLKNRRGDLTTLQDIMADGEKVENVILGGGEPGKYIGWELARQGRRTVIVERALIGGSCPNIACLPSKNVINSGKVADLVRHAAGYGQRTAPVATDMAGGGRGSARWATAWWGYLW